MLLSLPRAAWQFRGFILGSVKREFQARYQNSLLGALWTVINPLAMILVYTLVFSQLMKARLPGVDNGLAYSIHLCAGILTWGFFSEMIGKGQAMFLENARLLKKLSFPRICLPIVVLLNASLNFAIIFGLFIGFLLLSGNFPGWVILGVVPVIIFSSVLLPAPLMPITPTASPGRIWKLMSCSTHFRLCRGLENGVIHSRRRAQRVGYCL